MKLTNGNIKYYLQMMTLILGEVKYLPAMHYINILLSHYFKLVYTIKSTGTESSKYAILVHPSQTN